MSGSYRYRCETSGDRIAFPTLLPPIHRHYRTNTNTYTNSAGTPTSHESIQSTAQPVEDISRASSTFSSSTFSSLSSPARSNNSSCMGNTKHAQQEVLPCAEGGSLECWSLTRARKHAGLWTIHNNLGSECVPHPLRNSDSGVNGGDSPASKTGNTSRDLPLSDTQNRQVAQCTPKV